MSALAPYRDRRILFMLLLGFASGLPFPLLAGTLSAWMAAAGINLKTIGLFAWLLTPFNLKVLWAPILDRYRLPFGGRRRGWMAVFQLCLVFAIAALGQAANRAAGTVGAAGPVLATVVLSLVVATFAASQDVVSDAYRSDLLVGRELRARGTSVYIFGYRIAMLTSGGLALFLADHRMSWLNVYRLMGALLLIAPLITLLAPEPESDRPPRTIAAAVVEPLLDYFRRPSAIALLATIMLLGIGDSVARTMMTPFLVKTGFSLTEIGAVMKVFGILATIIGVLGGGALVARWGLARALRVFYCLQPLGSLCYAALALAGPRHAMLWLAVGVENIATGLCVAALDAFLIALCNKRYSATQFALLSSATSLVGRIVSGGSGWLQGWLGWPGFFALTASAVIPALMLLATLRRTIAAVDEGAKTEAATAAG